MQREELMKRIEVIQKENKDVKEYPNLLEVCEPGESGFVCRKVGTSGYVLICPLKLTPKKRIIQTADSNVLALEDFMGIYPYVAVVMESSAEQFKPGDVVLLDGRNMQSSATDVVVKAAMATLIPENCILGIDKNFAV